MSNPTQLGKTTRSSGLSLDKIINDPEAEIKDAATARTFLDQLYTIQGEPTTPEHISHTLFYISQTKGVNNTLCSAIHAMAYLVRELATSELTESIITAVSSKIENSVVAVISLQVANILSAAENLEKTNKNTRTTNDNTIKRIELITISPSHVDTPQLESHVKNLIEEMDAHAAIKEWQLLIDPDSNHPLLNNAATREATIDLIKQALETIDWVNSPNMQLKSIARLHNNGILLKFSNQEAVVWIKSLANKKAFLERLGGEVMIKDRHFNIVIPFLPITTETDKPETLCKMENKNNIPQGSITRIKWIKDPAKCTPGQHIAHTLASITSPEIANQLLRDVLYWGLDRFCPHKDKREPVRCLRCQ
ncbi:hypothetical protein M404DRAFT_151551 [Pisolithus tinctorius Marx 270]|uniref:Uncharacterized protein n=1 Tax=Pisolithus tinctorius Marx 270 TaxID=870435 RepID=A0A0C3P0B7_PISTI|nr:hypothetical protein M404DRAFT_151551 [Pisolithus tinctorius Marx 270]